MVKAAAVLLLLMLQSLQQQSWGQTADYFSSASDFARLYVGEVEPQFQASLWHDIPYYKGNTNLYKGRVSYHGVVYDDVQLRFNQLEQRIAVLSPVGNVLCLPEQEYIDWFEMDGYRYVHDPENSARYAALLCDGSINGIRLYHGVWKVYGGDNIVDGKQVQKNLSIKELYTLITPDGNRHQVKRASDIIRLFPDQKKQIRQTVRQHRLSFKKSRREESLVKVVESLVGEGIGTKSEELRTKS